MPHACAFVLGSAVAGRICSAEFHAVFRSPPMPVVLLHGLLSTPREFGLISLPLRAGGTSFIAPHVEGYTEAHGQGVKRWRDWLAAAETAVRQAIPEGQPFVLGGLCTGGLIAAALAIEGRLPVHALVLMSPTFAFDGWGRSPWWRWRWLAYVLGIERWISTAERSPFGIKNEKLRRWVQRDMKRRADSAAGPARLPLWAIAETERIAAHVVRNLGRLPPRTVLIHAREDEVCSLAQVERVFNAMPIDDKNLIVLENSFHMITLDNDRQRVVAELRKAALATDASSDWRNAETSMAGRACLSPLAMA